jgi:hypothetical protein
LEDLETELQTLRARYEGLQEKYTNLHILYMQRVASDGAAWSAGNLELAGGSGSAETGARSVEQVVKREDEGIRHLDLQQADIAAWLAATSGMS